MGRAPCCSKVGLTEVLGLPERTHCSPNILKHMVKATGDPCPKKLVWEELQAKMGKLPTARHQERGNITPDEDDLIIRMHSLLGNRWSLIAGRLPGRTDNEIKNYWNTRLSKTLMSEGTDPNTHQKISQPPAPKDKKRKKKYHNAKSTSNNEKRLVPKKPKVCFPKPTRVTSFVNLPRNDSITTARTSVSSSQDLVLDHVNNTMIPLSDFREGGVVFSSGDGSWPDFEIDRSRITRNVTADGDGHT